MDLSLAEVKDSVLIHYRSADIHDFDSDVESERVPEEASISSAVSTETDQNTAPVVTAVCPSPTTKVSTVQPHYYQSYHPWYIKTFKTDRSNKSNLVHTRIL